MQLQRLYFFGPKSSIRPATPSHTPTHVMYCRGRGAQSGAVGNNGAQRRNRINYWDRNKIELYFSNDIAGSSSVK